MRILYYDVGTGFLADTQKFNAVDELRKDGHDVIYVNPMEILGIETTPEEYSEVLLDRIRKEHDAGGIDMFFSVAWDSGLTPGAIADISRMGIPTVSFSTDDLSHPYRVRNITSSFDLCWSTARESESILRSYGAKKLIFLPFAANPHLFKPTGEPEKEVACFVGSAYGARAHGIASLAQAQVPIEVYGASPMDIYGSQGGGNPLTRALTSATNGWGRAVNSLSIPGGRKCLRAALKRSVLDMMGTLPEKRPMDGTVSYHGQVSYDEMTSIFSRSAVCYGSLEVASTYVLKDPMMFIRFREFEAAMSGAVHLVNRFPELEEYFEDGKEMLYYDTIEELVDKARFYLAPERAPERAAIRENAVRRARAEHTWMHRFRRITDELGIPC